MTIIIVFSVIFMIVIRFSQKNCTSKIESPFFKISLKVQENFIKGLGVVIV